MKERLTSRKIGHLVLVLIVLLSLVAWRTWFSGSPGEAIKKPDPICDLSHHSCSTRIDGQVLTVNVAPLPVRAERDMVLRLEGGVPAITPVTAWLEGRDMFMGRIPVQFEAREGGWQGRVQVGACTSDLMVWLLNIEWSNGQRQQVALSVSR